MDFELAGQVPEISQDLGTDSRAMRVLCLDIEGGHGGSSRSLYEILRHIDQDRAAPEVVCRRSGVIETRYAELGIPCRVEPKLPKCTSVPRVSRNLYLFGRRELSAWTNRGVARALARDINQRFDIVHFNHESFFQLAAWLRRRVGAAQVMHLRGISENTPFGRWQARKIARSVDQMIFITENERENFARLGGHREGRVIYNVAAKVTHATPDPRVKHDGKLIMASLSNYDFGRGVDRLLEVAAALRDRGSDTVRFVVAGDIKLSKKLPGDLGVIGRAGGTLEDVAAQRGLGDRFVFLGHVAEPERVLAAADVLARPTRRSDPWGRDVLESLAAGHPVFTVGTWQGFVTHRETGFIQPEFDAAEWADELEALNKDRDRLKRMGETARARISNLCDGPSRAADVIDVWRRALQISRARSS